MVQKLVFSAEKSPGQISPLGSDLSLDREPKKKKS